MVRGKKYKQTTLHINQTQAKDSLRTHKDRLGHTRTHIHEKEPVNNGLSAASMTSNSVYRLTLDDGR